MEGWVARDVVRHLVEWLPAFLQAGAGITLPALIVAIDHIGEINTAVRACEDRRAAVEVLTEAPFAFNEMQAQHVLDLRVANQVMRSRVDRVVEASSIAEAIDALKIEQGSRRSTP